MSTAVSKENQEIIDRMAKKCSPLELVKNIHLPTFISEYDENMKKVDKLASASKSLAKAYQRVCNGKADKDALEALYKALKDYREQMEELYNNVRLRVPDVLNLKHAAEQEYLQELARLNDARAKANMMLENIHNDYIFLENEMRTELAAATTLLARVEAGVKAGSMLSGARPEDEVLFRVANLRK
jgi:hypothetical protein